MALKRLGIPCLALLVVLVSGSSAAQSDEAPGPSATPRAPVATSTTTGPQPSASPSAARSAAPASSPSTDVLPEAIVELHEQANRIRALVAGRLDVGITPADLFTVALEDEKAIAVAILRLRTLVGQDAHRPPTPADKHDRAKSVEDNAAKSVAALYDARLALDRERLGFLKRPLEERRQLLTSHADGQRHAEDAEEKHRAVELEKERRAAEAKARAAKEAVKRATSETDRLLKLEHAALATLNTSLVNYQQTSAGRRAQFDQHQEDTLSLRASVRDFMTTSTVSRDAANRLFDQIRASLGVRRRELRQALLDLNAPPAPPRPGRSHLTDLSATTSTSAVTKKRRALENERRALSRKSQQLAQDTATLREDWAKLLHGEVRELNHDRLVLFREIGQAKRDAVTGFGAAGRNEAWAEASQVGLMLRYDYSVARRWYDDGRLGQQFGKLLAWQTSITALKWLLPFMVFIWWRRRSQRVLDSLAQRTKTRVGPMGDATRPTLGQRAARFIRHVHRPLEWLLLLWSAVALLPETAQTLLEVKVVSTIFRWTLGGRLVIDTIDYLASHENEPWNKTKEDVAPVRLRSLLLAGRVVVTFGLILALSQHLVGRGTAYAWVFRICWFAAIPVLLTVVHWWQDIIFAHVRAKPTRSALDVWVSNNETGIPSTLAAIVGGTKLLVTTTYRGLRHWLGSFDLTRLVHAYLFQRGMTKKADQTTEVHFGPIALETYEALGPRARACSIVASVADHQVADIIERIDKPGGGLFAIVGERGLGKSTLLARIAEEANDVTVVRCPFGGMTAFDEAFTNAFDGETGSSVEQTATRFDEATLDAGVLIDDAHRLIRPMMGGLKDFDRLLDSARRHSKHMTWVFAFDDVIWRFFEQMRGSRPLFDDVIRLKPWLEEGISNLLRSRSRNTSIEPCFEHIVGGFHPDVDAFDRDEALTRTEASYFRLIWSYAAGNPGVALHVWRTSLGMDDSERLSVRLFQAPDTDELDRLPDSAVFVLRAIVQLERGTVDDICQATGLPASSVQDALRYGLVRGYFRLVEDRYRIRWTWFRAITRFLQRRHLLFAGDST